MANIPKYDEYQYKGYTLRQFENVWHYQIIDNVTRRTVVVVNCTKKLTPDEAIDTINEFILTHNNKNAPKRNKKICPVCGKEFEPRRKNIVYCSAECKKKWKSSKIASYKRAKLIEQYKNNPIPEPKYKSIPRPKVETKICKFCGKPFKVSGKRKRKEFCSELCKGRYGYSLRLERQGLGMYQATDEQPCWSCKNACGGCSWSRSLTPIKGWKAKPTSFAYGTNSFEITYCPEYIRGR